MSEPRKFRNEKKLTDQKLFEVIQTCNYVSYFGDLVLDDGLSDIKETDTVSETSEVNDVLQNNDNNELSDSTNMLSQSVEYNSKDPNYITIM